MLVSALTFVLAILLPVQAALVEVIVDDQQGDPLTGAQVQYSANAWSKNPCDSCRAQPDPNKVYNGTWHDGTGNHGGMGPQSASISFKGTKISLQIIRTGAELSKAGVLGVDADLYFFIDGSLVNSHIEQAPTLGGDGFGYNYTVYSNDSLSDATHRFTVQAGHTGGPEALLLVDSFKYSYDDASHTGSSTSSATANATQSSTPKKSHTSIIAGVAAVVGALVVVLIGLLYLLCRRRRKNAAGKNSPSLLEVEPFEPKSPAQPTRFNTQMLYDEPLGSPTNMAAPAPFNAASRPTTTYSNITPYTGTPSQNMAADAPHQPEITYPTTRSTRPDQADGNMGSFTFTDSKRPFTTQTLEHNAGGSSAAADALETPPPYEPVGERR